MIDTYDQDGIKIDNLYFPQNIGSWELPGSVFFGCYKNPPTRWQRFWFRILLGMKWHKHEK